VGSAFAQKTKVIGELKVPITHLQFGESSAQSLWRAFKLISQSFSEVPTFASQPYLDLLLLPASQNKIYSELTSNLIPISSQA